MSVLIQMAIAVVLALMLVALILEWWVVRYRISRVIAVSLFCLFAVALFATVDAIYGTYSPEMPKLSAFDWGERSGLLEIDQFSALVDDRIDSARSSKGCDSSQAHKRGSSCPD